jgi:hypothetical protein
MIGQIKQITSILHGQIEHKGLARIVREIPLASQDHFSVYVYSIKEVYGLTQITSSL